MSKPREKVLVLGDGVSAFLAVIRSLGRQGIEVHVAWCQPNCPSLSSRYVAKFHPLPFCDAEGSWVDELCQLLQAEHYDLVLPTNEQSTRALFMHRERLEKASRLYLMDEPAFDVVFDKVKSGELAERVGMRVPKTQLISSVERLDDLESRFAYPLVLKPVSSYDAKSPTERRNVVKAYHREELDQQVQRLLGDGPVAVQENFIGRGVGVEMLVDRGEILLAFQHERVHQPLRGGASSYRKSVPLDAELLEASRRFVAALDYTGVIMVEFLVNDQGSDWRFVEANGRFWGSLPLAIAAGADFPFALYRLIVHGDRQFRQSYRTGLYCRNVLSDMLWFVQNLRADRNDPTLATVSPVSVLLEARHLLTGKERFDTFTLDDPLPALAEPLKYARRTLSRLGLRARQAWASLPGVRRRQAQQTRALLERARRIVFLCWGNICRSPFAAEYARRVWPSHIEVLSRGLHYQQGRVSPADAIEAARQCDIALGDHRSSLISAEEVDQSDVIICFDEMIRKVFLERYPQAAAKTVRFGTLRLEGPVTVADPFGGSLSDFSAAYAQIMGTIDASRELFAQPPSRIAMLQEPVAPVAGCGNTEGVV